MEDKKLRISTPASTDRDDATTWELPEGAIARLGRGGLWDLSFSPDGRSPQVKKSIPSGDTLQTFMTLRFLQIARS